jgi:hypothetical protein
MVLEAPRWFRALNPEFLEPEDKNNFDLSGAAFRARLCRFTASD